MRSGPGPFGFTDSQSELLLVAPFRKLKSRFPRVLPIPQGLCRGAAGPDNRNPHVVTE